MDKICTSERKKLLSHEYTLENGSTWRLALQNGRESRDEIAIRLEPIKSDMSGSGPFEWQIPCYQWPAVFGRLRLWDRPFFCFGGIDGVMDRGYLRYGGSLLQKDGSLHLKYRPAFTFNQMKFFDKPTDFVITTPSGVEQPVNRFRSFAILSVLIVHHSFASTGAPFCSEGE